ncbi:MAG: DUF2069 domain-containing protein [Oceanococcus sp.]
MTPRFFHILAAVSASGFMLVFLLWPTVLVPSRMGTVVMGLFSIPGLFALPGLIRGKVYTHAWSTLASTCYIAYCAMEAYVNLDARLPAVIGMSLGSVWFVASNLFVRGQRIQNVP